MLAKTSNAAQGQERIRGGAEGCLMGCLLHLQLILAAANFVPSISNQDVNDVILRYYPVITPGSYAY